MRNKRTERNQDWFVEATWCLIGVGGMGCAFPHKERISHVVEHTSEVQQGRPPQAKVPRCRLLSDTTQSQSVQRQQMQCNSQTKCERPLGKSPSRSACGQSQRKSLPSLSPAHSHACHDHYEMHLRGRYAQVRTQHHPQRIPKGKLQRCRKLHARPHTILRAKLCN